MIFSKIIPMYSDMGQEYKNEKGQVATIVATGNALHFTLRKEMIRDIHTIIFLIDWQNRRGDWASLVEAEDFAESEEGTAKFTAIARKMFEEFCEYHAGRFAHAAADLRVSFE